MPTVQKGPNQPWPDLFAGLEIQLEPGEHQPKEFSGTRDVAILGCEGAKIVGSINPGGGEPPCGLRFNDGCHGLRIFGPLEQSGSDGRGIRITVAEEIELRDLYCHHNSIEGIITGNCPRSVYENIRVETSVASGVSWVRADYPPDKRHGMYLSGDASESTVRGLTVVRVTGSGLQLNGAGMNEIIRDLSASELAFYHCGSSGTPPLSLMAVRESEIEEFFESWTASDRWAVCFADGKSGYYCEDVTFRTYTVPEGTYCAVEQGSRNISTQPGAGWTPTAPEPPEPEPPTPDGDMQALIDEAQAALGAVASQQVIATNALVVIGQQTAVAQEALAKMEALAGSPGRRSS